MLGIFLKFPNFLRFCVFELDPVRQLVRKIAHSLSGDNNLVAFSTFDLEKYTTLDIETLRL